MRLFDTQKRKNALSRDAERILLEGSLLAEVEAWGEFQFRDLGRMAYPRMAKTLLLKRTPNITKPETNFVIRGEGHTLFLWEKGWTKSSIVEAFWGVGRNREQGLVGEVGRIEQIFRISPERFGGSVNNGRILWPKPLHCDVIIVDEWKAFVGSGPKEVDMINIVNPVIERGEGGFDLVKSSLAKDAFKRQRSELPMELQSKIRYFPPSRIEYDANATFIAATYNLDKKSLLRLDETGVLSRFDVCTLEVGGLEARFELIHDINEGGKTPLSAKEGIREAFSHLRKLNFDEVVAPPQSWLTDLLHEYEDQLEDLSLGGLDDMVNMRLPGRLIREMTAHAISKQFQRQGGLEANLERVVYDPEDRDYVLGEIGTILESDIRLKLLTRAGSLASSRVDAETKLVDILRAAGGEMSLKDFKSEARRVLVVKDRQVRNYISKLENDRKAERFRDGRIWYIKGQSEEGGNGKIRSKIAT